MIAGTIGLLDRPVDDPLESQSSSGFSTLDVRETQTAITSDAPIQTGRVCATVESRDEDIAVYGTTIDVETVAGQQRVWTPWVADVTDAGFVAAERTRGEFPFDVFWSATGRRVEPATIDVAGIIKTFRDGDRDIDTWMVGSSEGGAEMRYHTHARPAAAARADIGVGFELPWSGTTARGVMYEGGYVAIYSGGWGATKFAAFITDVILPHADVVDETAEQQTLDGDTEVDA